MKQTQVDKEQLAITIAEKLGKYSGVSYHSIAEMAANTGRIQLAIKVCTYIISLDWCYVKLYIRFNI